MIRTSTFCLDFNGPTWALPAFEILGCLQELGFPKNKKAQPGTSIRIVSVTAAQKSAARKNIKKAAAKAKEKRTVAHLPKATRTALGKAGAKAAQEKQAAETK